MSPSFLMFLNCEDICYLMWIMMNYYLDLNDLSVDFIG